MRKKPITLSLDDESRAQCKTLADRLGLWLSAYLRVLIRENYKNFELPVAEVRSQN